MYSIQSNGNHHFTTNTGAGIRTNPAVYGDAAVFVGNDAGRVISYDLNGQQRYSFTSGTAAVTAGPVVDSLANAYYGTADGRMISLDKDGNFLGGAFKPVMQSTVVQLSMSRKTYFLARMITIYTPLIKMDPNSGDTIQELPYALHPLFLLKAASLWGLLIKLCFI